ncbi:hypothetical protein STAS_28937 [Striga asiatica]|uniref:Neprosin activation peptide domain-containing protein n=1 Tax=Striga asiatica TaxID=4170 RepID=A0A5A7R2C4_STRAF|nr:hypothetical protein STAS_28937 [Striga asiatica]
MVATPMGVSFSGSDGDHCSGFPRRLPSVADLVVLPPQLAQVAADWRSDSPSPGEVTRFRLKTSWRCRAVGGWEPPEIPKRTTPRNGNFKENHQIWTMAGEFCPKNTVPIRRTTEEDVLRASSLEKFGRKQIRPPVQREAIGDGHEVS